MRSGDLALPSPHACEFAHYIDEQTGPIGRVVGSEQEPAGSHVFAIWAIGRSRHT